MNERAKAFFALNGGPPTWNMNMFMTRGHLKARGFADPKVGDVVQVGHRVIVCVAG